MSESATQTMGQAVFVVLLACLSLPYISATSQYACTKTQVAVLGAGVAGITAAVQKDLDLHSIRADMINGKRCPTIRSQTLSSLSTIRR